MTAYVDHITSTEVHGIAPPSALRTASLSELQQGITAAQGLGLKVILAPVLDVNWDIPSNIRCFWNAGYVSRSDIGADFSASEWDQVFEAYTSWLLPLAHLANTSNVGIFQVADELTQFYKEEQRMRKLIASIRTVYSGQLTASANGDSLASIAWWDAVDLITHAAFWPLGDVQPAAQPLSVAGMAAGWDRAIALISSVSNATHRPVLIHAGFQSRPNCHVTPWGTGGTGQGNDQGDVSAWVVAYDMLCQANAYEGTMRALSTQHWFAGLLWWKWSADPSQGGTCDTDYTPHGKPAEVVVKKWFQGNMSACGTTSTSAYSPRFLSPQLPSQGNSSSNSSNNSNNSKNNNSSNTGSLLLASEGELSIGETRASWLPMSSPEDNVCDGSATLMERVYQRLLDLAPPALHATDSVSRSSNHTSQLFTGFRGFCYGGPDEWSSPSYRLDSPGSAQSLANMARLGANAVELIVQWWITDINNHSMYAITEPTSPLRTSTDAEIRVFAQQAHSLGLQVVLTPMLDPDWALPSQFGCRKATRNTNAAQAATARGEQGVNRGQRVSDNCSWRGQIGQNWNCSACEAGSDWGVWHDNYHQFIMHYAELAAELRFEGFLLAHELETPCRCCATRWRQLLASIRGVYHGDVSVAVLTDAFSADPAYIGWLQQLDWVGVDCYIGSNGTSHPSVPWADASLASLKSGITAAADGIKSFAAKTGKAIACTEVGWVSGPWAGETGWGDVLDKADSSVFSQSTWGPAQALAYQAFIEVFEGFAFYRGGFHWLWRADPTAGTFSDNSPTPWGKEAAVAIAQMWGK